MDVFGLRERVVDAYSRYVMSFLSIRDPDIKKSVEDFLAAGRLWPDPLVQLNPAFQPDATAAALIGCLASLPFDYSVRPKVGGTHLNFFAVNQLAVLPPSAFTTDDLAFIAPRVLN